MARSSVLLVLLVPLAWGDAAAAAELLSASLERDGTRYHVALQVKIDAPLDEVHALLADYARMSSLNPGVVESAVLSRTGEVSLVRLAIRACAGFFCREFRQVQTMRSMRDDDGYLIVAEVQPERSDLDYGVARWRLRACADGSYMDFESSVEPGVWVPPLIGPWLIRRSTIDQTLHTARNIEALLRPAMP